MAETYRTGEVVDITIKGAYVVHTTETEDGPVLSVSTNRSDIAVVVTDAAVTITRVAPPEWPPCQGDVWVDRDGDPWMTVTHQMRAYPGGNTPGPGDWMPFDAVLRTYGPLRLIHRKGGA